MMNDTPAVYPCCSHCNIASIFPCFQNGNGHPVPCAIPSCPGAQIHVPECNGICLTAADIGLYSDDIAYPHPDCEVHGKYALFEVDGTPRHFTEEIS